MDVGVVRSAVDAAVARSGCGVAFDVDAADVRVRSGECQNSGVRSVDEGGPCSRSREVDDDAGCHAADLDGGPAALERLIALKRLRAGDVARTGNGDDERVGACGGGYGRKVAIAVDRPSDPSDIRAREPIFLNEDTRPDFVVANAGSQFLSIFYGAEGGYTVALRDIPGTATTVAAADFNQDGRVDIVAGRGSDALFLMQQRVEGGQSVFQSSNFGSGGTVKAPNTRGVGSP